MTARVTRPTVSAAALRLSSSPRGQPEPVPVGERSAMDVLGLRENLGQSEAFPY
ncbi:MAG TPA: hypothetical protein VGG75_31010 [Trebonia sp.]